MNEHLTPGDLTAFLDGRLPPRRVPDVVEHLRHCPHCSSSARGSELAARAAGRLAWQLAADGDEHPPVETTLTAYVDGTLSEDDAAAAEAHLEVCARCREDVEDLQAIASTLRQRPRRSWFPSAVAAAALLAIVATLVLLRRAPVPLPPVTATAVAHPATHTAATQTAATQYERPEWRAAVDEALRTGALPMPAALAGLRVAPDVLRTPGEREAEERLQPVRTVVETTRPRFTWTPAEGATYLVSVFDDDTLVAESGVLSEPAWQPERDLPRGRTVQWEVEIRGGDGSVRNLPAPPAPPALFRVLDAAAHAELQRARAEYGDDPLLLGVLYARSGLREDAARELRRVRTEQGRRLLRSVEQWPR